MAFFDSDIVQDEAKRLFGDYQQLMQLGSEYGKFDREGKKKFIETMEELMGRYRVFMKRFELSEDFQAKLTVEQLRTQLSQFGIPRADVRSDELHPGADEGADRAAAFQLKQPRLNQLELSQDSYDRQRSLVAPPHACLLYTSPSPRDQRGSRMPSSA